VEALAKKENKIPVLVIKKKGRHGELFIVNDKYLKAFIENWEAKGEIHFSKPDEKDYRLQRIKARRL